jgi:antitoxin (DNA-binding transcriptional repressor) of toxin-antitoxin stability system
VSASEVKKGWHHYVDRVAQAREVIVVTRYGRPVAKLSPVGEASSAGSLIGALAGTVTFHGDVVAPTGEQWDADA